ncbi:MAG: hypothetical protein KAV48_03505 [Methanomicrobia archaeon]|nr:hypothetical protein [Methanomicrobia archaeon]
MKLLFYLSGENIDLSRKEVIYLLKAFDKKYKIIEAKDQILIIETDIDFKVFKRLGLCHKVLEYMDEEIILDGTFAVRVQNLGEKKGNKELEKKIADEIQKQNDFSLKTDLENPQNEIYCLCSEKLYIGKTLITIDRKEYEKRKPQFRPYFHPSSLHPKYARALINLSQAQKELLDPFCGTGGILIEGGLMGLKVFGLDIEKKMVEGCKKNLDFYGIKDYSIKEGSVEHLDSYFQNIESTATDVPYGKSTKLKKDIYEMAFEKIYETSKKACIVLNKEYDFEKIGFKLLDTEKLRMHRSLTRFIYVLQCE